MKILHLSDLHIGKRVNEFSLLEDQAYILDQIVEIAKREKIDSVLIAGDVYDKAIPPGEAVQLFDNFLSVLSSGDIEVFIISGNHDSPERLSFGAELMRKSGVYIAPVFDGQVHSFSPKKGEGKVQIYLLPFIKPSQVRYFFPEIEISTYTQALQTIMEQIKLEPNRTNILVTHQFVTGAQTCESEEMSVGGTDPVAVEVFSSFDYVALGHLHGPQTVGREENRYCGTPLKYSFSEAKHQKSVTILTVDTANNTVNRESKRAEKNSLGEKPKLNIQLFPLSPKRDMREIKGTYQDLTARANYIHTNVEDFIHITLTDEEDVVEALAKLRTIYPNIMKLDYDNQRTREQQIISVESRIDQKTPLQLLEEFYFLQNNQTMSKEQLDLAESLMERIWEKEL